MNNKTTQWAFLVLAFVAGIGTGYTLTNTRSNHRMEAKQAEWQRGTRQRFSEMRERADIKPINLDRGKKGGTGKTPRKRGEGGPK
mgnify:FL=1